MPHAVTPTPSQLSQPALSLTRKPANMRAASVGRARILRLPAPHLRPSLQRRPVHTAESPPKARQQWPQYSYVIPGAIALGLVYLALRRERARERLASTILQQKIDRIVTLAQEVQEGKNEKAGSETS
jgi:hypothetical protein